MIKNTGTYLGYYLTYFFNRSSLVNIEYESIIAILNSPIEKVSSLELSLLTTSQAPCYGKNTVRLTFRDEN